MFPSYLEVLPDTQQLAARACHLITQSAEQAIQERGAFHLVLAGGTTPQQAYHLLAATLQNWQHWHIYWGDERCLAADDPQRNSVLAQHSWLQHVAIPAENIHPIPAELGAQAAAEAYQAQILPHLPFDLVLLGIGEDGHTASLFPQDMPFEQQEAWVVAVDNAPKAPAQRVSLSQYTLQQCRQQLLLVSGTNKAEVLQRWQQGETFPISTVAQPHCWLLVDYAAAH